MTKLWNFLERIGVFCCIFGTAIAIVRQQPNYAIVPITATVSISYINRLQQKTYLKSRSSKQEVKKINKQLNHIFNHLNHSQSLTSEPRFLELEKALLKLNKKVISVQKEISTNISGKAQYYDNLSHKNLQTQLDQFRQEIESLYWEQIETIINYLKQLETNNDYDYTLITGRSQSHDILINALQEAEEQVIMVCPWLGYGFNEKIFTLCQNLLKRGVYLKIGWGKSDDIKQNNLDRSFNIHSHYLDKLKQFAPYQLSDKLIGTHEKFLVCDHKYAMLGSHNFLTSGPQENERELGLKTNDPRLINQLIQRFNQAKSIN